MVEGKRITLEIRERKEQRAFWTRGLTIRTENSEEAQ